MKRLLKFLLSCGFYSLSQVYRLGLSLVGRPADPTWVILNYHGILPEQREAFAKQMDWLQRKMKAIPVDSSSRLQPDQRYASVTFDDGLACLIKNAIPELRKRGIPATVFVVAGKLGE